MMSVEERITSALTPLRPTINRHLERAEVKLIDVKAGRISAVVSTETRDRDGDIIRVAGWELDNFMRNPVMLDSHHYGSVAAVIGRWDDMAVKGKKLIGEATYRIGRGQQNADIAFDIAKDGGAAFSVGFLPDMAKAKEIDSGNDFFPNFEFNGQELLEVSQVSVPSNPDAMQRMKGLHPVLDSIIQDKLITITIDDDKQAAEIDDDIKTLVAELLSKNLDARLLLIEEELIPLIKLLHTHPGGPEPEVDSSDDELLKFMATHSIRWYRIHTLKSAHGEHGHEGNGSHEHDDDKGIDFARIFREAREEARR